MKGVSRLPDRWLTLIFYILYFILGDKGVSRLPDRWLTLIFYILY